MSRCAPVVFSPEYECDIGPHVFPTQKYRLVRDGLIAAGVLAASEVLVPAAAPREDLLLVHGADYLDDLERLRWTSRTRMSELPLTPAIEVFSNDERLRNLDDFRDVAVDSEIAVVAD